MADEKKPLELLSEDTLYFLDKRGVSLDTLKILEGENRSEDYDRDTVVKQHEETQRKIFENNISDDFIAARTDEQFKTLKGTNAHKISKLVGLGLTSKECRELGFEEVMKKAEERYQSNIASASEGGDDEIRGQVKEWQDKYISEKEARESDKSAYDTKIQEVESQSNERLKRINVDSSFKKSFSARKWGIDAKLIPIVQKQIQREIEEKYDVIPDDDKPKLSGKNGMNPISFDGKTSYTYLDEAIEHKFNEYNVSQQSQTGTPPNTPPAAAPVNVGEMDEETKQWMARMQEKKQAAY